MMGHFSIIPNDDSRHGLLEPPSPAYSNVTVRRAFIVWLHCGQQNEFRHVCNYFHYLESLEEQLSADARARSRLHEFNLFTNYPPSSNFLSKNYPKLYNKHNIINVKKIEEIKLEDCVFNLEGFHELKIQKGVTTKEIIKTSQMIKNYCKTHYKSLRNFLTEFQNFTKKTEATDSVDNIAMYIKKKNLEDELETWKNLRKDFSFLDIFDDTNKDNIDVTKTEIISSITSTTLAEDHTFNANKNANKIRILINESRRKEFLNMMPTLSELSIKDRNSGYSNQNVLKTTLTNLTKQK